MNITNKSDLRRQILESRNHLNEIYRERANLLITEKVLGHNWFQNSTNILFYVNTGSEVETRVIISEALRQGKNVYVPKVCGDFMEFYKIDSLTDLKEGFKGILEPNSNLPQFIYSKLHNENTLMIMPGVVFDRNRTRVGYGRGYYDRYLSDKNKLHKMALAFECQFVDYIEPMEYDIKPDVIISEAIQKGGFQ